MIFNQIKSILIKDFLIEFSYKGRFIYSVLFIFIQLAVFYSLTSFLESSYTKNDESPISNLFGFFIIGICFFRYILYIDFLFKHQDRRIQKNRNL